MNKQNKSPWLRCFSKQKKRIYYCNPITNESYWNGPKGIAIVDHESVLEMENNGDAEVLKKKSSVRSPSKRENTMMSPGAQLELNNQLVDPCQVQDCSLTQGNSPEEADLDDNILEKLYAPKEADKSLVKSQRTHIKDNLLPQKSNHEEDLDEVELEKLYAPKQPKQSSVTKSQPTQVHNNKLTRKNSCEDEDFDLQKLYAPKEADKSLVKSQRTHIKDNLLPQKNNHEEDLDEVALEKLYAPKQPMQSSVAKSQPTQVHNNKLTRKNSCEEEDFDLQKLYATKQPMQSVAKSQPTQVHNNKLTRKNSCEKEDFNKNLQKLHATKLATQNIAPLDQPALKQPCDSLQNREHRKRRSGECDYTQPDHTAKRLAEVSNKLHTLYSPEDGTSRVLSRKPSPQKWALHKITKGTFRTPIQDRFDKAKEELLKNQQLRSSGVPTEYDSSTINQPSAKCTSRPVLGAASNNQPDARNVNEESNAPSSIRDRIGWKKPILKQATSSDVTPQNGSVHIGLKRKATSSEGGDDRHSDSSDLSIKKRISFGGDDRRSDSSELSIKKQISFGEAKRSSLESGLSNKKQSTFDELRRHSLESGSLVRKPISFGEVKRSSLESGTSIKKPITFGESIKFSAMTVESSSPGDERKLCGEIKRYSSESVSSVKKPSSFDLRMKLQQVKRGSTDASSSSCQMDWEPNEVCSPHSDNIVMKEDSPVAQEKRPSFKNIYLVCDTSALLNDYNFVEQLIVKGTYLGLPFTIVIPYVVFDELDQLKVKDDVGHKARHISRIIQSSKSSKNLLVQDGNKKREAVGSLELKVNDDLVLNCCLQIRETCSENDLAVLMTTDINLENKATSFKVQSHNWNSLKSWARGLREYKQLSPQKPKQVKIKDDNLKEEEQMDVDLNVTNSENKARFSGYSYCLSKDDLTVDNNKEATDSKSSQLQNCIRSHLEELKSDFQTFLHNVIEEAVEKEHGHLSWTKFTNNIMPSWTLLHYVVEVRQRWFLITSSMMSNNIQEIIANIIRLIKKYNSGKEELEVVDVTNYFELCASLGDIISKYFPKHANFFLERLNVLWGEWKEAHSSLSSTNISQNMSEEDVQPVDVALQNICNYLHSYYENLKTQFENNECEQDFKERLSVFNSKITSVESVIKNVFKETPVKLTRTNKKLVEFHKSISCFSGVGGSPFGFEIFIENVIEFFQDTSYRKLIRHVIYNLGHLKTLVDELSRRYH